VLHLRQLTHKLLWLVIICLCSLSTPSANAAAILRRSDPADGARLEHPPAEVFAWFAAPISGHSQLAVFDDDFNNVSHGQAYIDQNDVTLLRVPLKTLLPGRYTVRWQADSRDGHTEVGTFYFSVLPAPLPVPLPVLLGAGVSAVVFLTSFAVWWLLRRFRRSSQR
jgi:methionine-rich copper-binding protein CopC